MAKKKGETDENSALEEISEIDEKAVPEVKEEEEEVAIKVPQKFFQVVAEHEESNAFIVWDDTHIKESFYVTNLKIKETEGKFGKSFVASATRIIPAKKKTCLIKFGIPQSLQTQFNKLGIANTPEGMVVRIYYAGMKNFEGTDFQSFFVEIIQK